MKPAPADPLFVRRVLEESGVDQAVPSPGWSGYAERVAEAVFDSIREKIPALDGLAALAKSLGPAVAVAAAVLVLGILFGLVRSALRRRRTGAATRAATRTVPSALSDPERDRAGWRAEMERHLARADVTAALEALWWWFARSVSPVRVDRSWTSQELLARCCRVDLAPWARALDRLLYGSERPTVDDVRRFHGQLETLLP